MPATREREVDLRHDRFGEARHSSVSCTTPTIWNASFATLNGGSFSRGSLHRLPERRAAVEPRADEALVDERDRARRRPRRSR